MSQRRIWIFAAALAIVGVAGITALTSPGRPTQAEEVKVADDLPTPHELLAALPGELTPRIPLDVNRDLQKKLVDQKKFAEEQLLFDLLSWRTFVALNWPVDAAGNPQPKITDPGRKYWDTFKTDLDTFLPDGTKPAPWGSNHLNQYLAARGIQAGAGTRVLDSLSSVHGHLNFKISKVPDVTQAFKFPIWDQNGNMLRYEILLNQDEFDYIVANDLYSLDGQAAFSIKGGKVSFPMDNPESGKLGAMELKLAWKVLDPSKGDLPERFLTVKATIFSGPDGTTPTQATLGLVAMHISHRTQSSPQWIWSTFIHVDSLQTNSLATFHGKPIPTLFYNPGNPTAPVNVPSQTTPPFLDGQTPTQVLALTAIPLATQEVNRVARHELERRGSVLQYFELMNTQWPTNPATPPTPPGMLPASIDNKAGGRPTPVYLINPLMETYFQLGNQPAGPQEQAGTDQTQVFGTESCVGCHSSAPVNYAVAIGPNGVKTAVQGPAFSGEFSWLLFRRAQFTK